MRVRFDVDFDGYPWPGPLRARPAEFGAAWTGPRGFLNLLETQLGLNGPNVSDGVRAATLVPALRETPGFWTQSLEVDPLAVARTLLSWRDMLRAGGWRGEPVSPRLQSLASLHDAFLPGEVDRLIDCRERLATQKTDIAAVELFETRNVQSPLWQSVLTRLESATVNVTEIQEADAVSAGDLAASRLPGFRPTGDGSLQLLRPQGPQVAADCVAAWLAAQADLAGTVIVTPDPVLDSALRRHGLPTLGAAGRRCDVALLETLPLIIQMGWSPPDPARALELLTLPLSPVPRGIRWRLAEALKQWPAVDSDAWRSALTDGLQKIEDEADRQRVAARLDVLLKPSVSGATYPVTELLRRTQTLVTWLQGMLQSEQAAAEECQAAIIQCAAFRRLLDLLGMKTLNRPQLQRILDEATREVPPIPRHAPQAGLHGVSSPGAVGSVAQRVVWWNFHRKAVAGLESLPLTTIETKALAAAGIVLPDPAQVALAINARWSRPLRFAGQALVLVCPKYGDDGEVLHPHPLWDQIAAGLVDAKAASRVTFDRPHSQVPPKQATGVLLSPPRPRREWTLPADVPVTPREKESPSGAGSLIGCPFQWTLRYMGRIRGGDAAALPDGDQLIGLVAHEILGRVLMSNPPTPEAAEDQALQLFDGDGPRLAATLFMPGHEKLKQSSRRATSRAARTLVKHLRDAGLKVLNVEQTHSRPALGSTLAGRTDVVVGPPNAVIDLKWSREDDHRSELTAGAGFQLASYSYLLGNGQPMPPVAFFIIRTQRMLTTHDGLFDGVTAIAGPPPQDVWKATEHSYLQRRAELNARLVLAPGDRDENGELQPKESHLVDGRLNLVPPCHFCSFGLLCGHGLEVDPGVEHQVVEGM